MTRHVHHAVAHRSTGKYTDGGYEHYGLEPRHLCSDGRIKEIDGIIAHTHHEVEHRQNDEEYYYPEKQCIHN